MLEHVGETIALGAAMMVIGFGFNLLMRFFWPRSDQEQTNSKVFRGFADFSGFYTLLHPFLTAALLLYLKYKFAPYGFNFTDIALGWWLLSLPTSLLTWAKFQVSASLAGSWALCSLLESYLAAQLDATWFSAH